MALIAWNAEDIALLRERYPEQGMACWVLFEGRTKNSVKTKAFRLGIKCSNPKTTKMTNADYDLKISGRTLIRIGEYIGSKTKLLHKCLVCDHEWEAIPNSILSQSSGCPNCANDSRTKTSSMYDGQIKDRPLIRLGEYIGSMDKLLHKCSVCDHEWEAIPNNILNGSGCPKCALNAKKTSSTYDEDIKDRPFVRIGEYDGNKTKITHKCSACEHEWRVRPNDILDGHGCPKCNTGGTNYLNEQIIFIYLVKITTVKEVFLKVGVSSNLNGRLQQIKNTTKAIEVELIHSVEGNAEVLVPLERKILRESNLVQYHPEAKFCGHTECLHIDEIDKVLQLMKGAANG